MQINLRRTPTAVTEEELNRFNGRALLQQSCCKRMPQDMRGEFATQAALLASRLDRLAQGTFGDRQTVGSGKDVFGIAMNLPCFTQQGQEGRADWNDTFPIAFADVAQEHRLGINGGDGKLGRFADAQSAGIHHRGTGSINRMLDGSDQTLTLVVGLGNRQPEAQRQFDFFFVKMLHSRPSVR